MSLGTSQGAVVAGDRMNTRTDSAQRRRRGRRACPAILAAAAAATALLGSSSLRAASTLTWDNDGAGVPAGGSGIWDTTAANWTADNGATYAAWNNANGDTAVFGATAGTVTLGAAITAGGLTFNSAYVVDLNGFDLSNGATLGGGALSAAVIRNTSATTSNYTATLFNNSGPKFSGNLNLNYNFNSATAWQPAADNDYTGVLTQSTGVIRGDHDGQFGTAAASIKLTGTATFSGAVTGGLQSGSLSKAFELVGSTQQFSINGVKAFTLSGPISGAGDLRLTGSQGMLIVSGNNSFTGATTLGGTSIVVAASNNALGNIATTLNMTNASVLGLQGNISIGAKPLTLGAGPHSSGYGALHNFSGDNSYAGTISLGSNTPRLIGAEAGSSLTLSGVLSSSRGISKIGNGTVILTAANIYGTSSTPAQAGSNVNEGTLRLDFSAAGAPVSDIVNNGLVVTGTTGSSQLTLGGGTLEIKGASGATNSQRFKNSTNVGFAINPGASSIVVNQNGATSVTLNTGLLTTANRAIGGTVDFTLPSSGGIVMPSGTGTVGANGALITASGAAFATVGGSEWAALDAAGNRTVVPGSSIAGFYTNNDATTLSGNADMSGGVDVALAAPTTIGSLRFNDATAARTVDLGGQALTTGGILITPAVAANVSTISGAGSLAGAAGKDLLVIQNNSAAPLNVSAIIADNTTSTGLTKSGPGTMVLSGANTYSGNTNVNGGMLKLDNASALGQTSGNVALHNGVLGLSNNFGDFTRAVGTGANQVQFLGSGGFAAYGGDRIVNLGGAAASLTWGGSSGSGTAGFLPTGSTLVLGAPDATGMVDFKNPLNLNSVAVPTPRTIQVDNGSTTIDARLSGVVSGESPLNKTGLGTLEMTAANTFVGPFSITAGGVVLSTGTLVGASGNVSVVNVSNGASLAIGTGAATGSINGPLADNGTVTFNRTDTVTYGGVISGNGALNFSGTGTVILTGNSTFTGATTVNPGTLQIGNAGTSGSFAGNLTNNGAVIFSRSDTGSSYGGAISGSGTVTKAGAGTVALTATTSTYSGQTLLNAGTLQFAGNGSLGTGNITFNGGGLKYATDNIADISNRTVTIAASGASVDTNGNNVVFANAIGNGGAGAFTKTGAGSLTLNGNNTYTGATTVNNGTLVLTGTNMTSGSTVNSGALIANSATSSGTGNVTVNSGTIGGSGIIGAVTVNTTGHVAPGSGGAGTLTAGALTLKTGTSFDYDLSNVTTVGGGVNDLLSVSSGSNPTPLATDSFTLNINVTNTNLVGGTYHIIDSASPLGLDPSKWSVGTNNASGTYTFAFSLDGNGDLVLGVTPLVVGPTDSIWNKDDSVSLWSDPNSWTGGVPNAVDAKATFGSKITSDRSVIVDGQQIVGTMTFDNANKYTLVSGNFGGLIVVDSSTTGSVTVNSGSHDIVTPVQLNKDTTFTVTPPASTLTVSDLTAAGVNVTKAGAGTLAVNRVRSNDLTINGGTLRVLPNGLGISVSKVAAVNVAAGAKIDLTENKLISKATPVGTLGTGNTYSGVTGLIQSGRNGGDWSGSGIVTSSASGNFTTLGVASAQQALGLSSATDTGVWAGQAVTGSDALVIYTYGGDANLDGKVNVDDYGRIDFNVNLGTSGWFNGDFNYDGKINVDDYGIIDFNVGIQGAPFFTAAGGVANAAMNGVSAVPEPASIGLMSLSAVALAGRRRRRRN